MWITLYYTLVCTKGLEISSLKFLLLKNVNKLHLLSFFLRDFASKPFLLLSYSSTDSDVTTSQCPAMDSQEKGMGGLHITMENCSFMAFCNLEYLFQMYILSVACYVC